jgi:hypothetical protein
VEDHFGENQHDDFTATLPTAGDMDGCGGVKVLESTVDYARIEWTICSADTISTLTLGLRRAAR